MQDLATSYRAVFSIVNGRCYRYAFDGSTVEGHYSMASAPSCSLAVDDQGQQTSPGLGPYHRENRSSIDMSHATDVTFVAALGLSEAVWVTGPSLNDGEPGPGFGINGTADVAPRLIAALVDLAHACGADPTITP